MNRLAVAAGALVVVVLSMAFASLNSNQRVTLRLGFGTYYGVPLTVIAFGGVIVGMLIMLVAGIRSDLKVRRILRARLEEEDREERARFVDHAQQDLFADSAQGHDAGRKRGHDAGDERGHDGEGTRARLTDGAPAVFAERTERKERS